MNDQLSTITISPTESAIYRSDRPYQICSETVMDTFDPSITFDNEGRCNYYNDYCAKNIAFDEPTRKRVLDEELAMIRKRGRGKDYDCIVGLSGGVDSSYLAYIASNWGLRILAVHVDGGWNSELAVSNIEKIVTKCGIDLYTHVVDWDDMRDLQLAYFRAGLANQDVPQDHAFFAALYSFAVKNKINTVIHGGNVATEYVLPEAWGYNAMDAKNIVAIHERFGTRKLKQFPLVGFFKYHFYYPYVIRMHVVRPLNLIDYNQEKAISELEEELGWVYYGGKHFESRFTRFFQAYYLPKRFGFDKRRAHMSSLILSGQMTRSRAVELLREPLYQSVALLDSDREYVIKKLGIDEDEYQKIMAEPPRQYSEFPSHENLVRLKAKLNGLVSKLWRQTR